MGSPLKLLAGGASGGGAFNGATETVPARLMTIARVGAARASVMPSRIASPCISGVYSPEHETTRTSPSRRARTASTTTPIYYSPDECQPTLTLDRMPERANFFTVCTGRAHALHGSNMGCFTAEQDTIVSLRMNMRIVLMAALLLTGCVTSPEEFERTRLSRSDTSLCRINQYALNHNPPMIGPTSQELQRRGIAPERCQELIAEFNRQNAALIAAGLTLMAGPRAAPPVPAVDLDWDWDQFYDNGVLVWACRGLQTGQFAEPYRCQYKMQTDWRWPSKSAW